jgi:hypothetical protein
MKTMTAGFLMFATLAAPASATMFEHTYQRHAAPGHEIRINVYMQHGRDCSPMRNPTIDVDTKPSHGMVSIRDYAGISSAPRIGAIDCTGKPLTGLAVYYTPDAGFTGTDQFDYSVAFSNGGLHDAAVVTVR